MEKLNFNRTNQIRPFLEKDEVNKKFFINRCKNDTQILQHLQKEKTEFYEEALKSSPHSFIRIPYFRHKAKKIIWAGLQDGFNFFSDHTRLNELYPPYKFIDERKIPRDVRDTSYYSIFMTITMMGLALGLVVAASTGILSLLQGGLIGMGVGLTLGSITGHITCNRIHTIYEKIYSTGFKKGGELVSNGIENNTKIMENAMSYIYGNNEKPTSPTEHVSSIKHSYPQENIIQNHNWQERIMHDMSSERELV